jgi:hypothetical protein
MLGLLQTPPLAGAVLGVGQTGVGGTVVVLLADALRGTLGQVCTLLRA